VKWISIRAIPVSAILPISKKRKRADAGS
jgi:hypothetical protein